MAGKPQQMKFPYPPGPFAGLETRESHLAANQLLSGRNVSLREGDLRQRPGSSVMAQQSAAGGTVVCLYGSLGMFEYKYGDLTHYILSLRRHDTDDKIIYVDALKVGESNWVRNILQFAVTDASLLWTGTQIEIFHKHPTDILLSERSSALLLTNGHDPAQLIAYSGEELSIFPGFPGVGWVTAPFACEVGSPADDYIQPADTFKFTCATLHKQCAVLAGDPVVTQMNLIRVSNLNFHQRFKSDSYIRIDRKDADRVVGVRSLVGGRLYIFLRGSIYTWDGDQPSDGYNPAPEILTNNFGAVSDQGIARCDAEGVLYFISASGFFRLETAGQPVKISTPIQAEFDALAKNRLFMGQVIPVPEREEIWFAAPSVDALYNDRVFVWNYAKGLWYPPWEMQISAACAVDQVSGGSMTVIADNGFSVEHDLDSLTVSKVENPIEHYSSISYAARGLAADIKIGFPIGGQNALLAGCEFLPGGVVLYFGADHVAGNFSCSYYNDGGNQQSLSILNYADGLGPGEIGRIYFDQPAAWVSHVFNTGDRVTSALYFFAVLGISEIHCTKIKALRYAKFFLLNSDSYGNEQDGETMRAYDLRAKLPLRYQEQQIKNFGDLLLNVLNAGAATLYVRPLIDESAFQEPLLKYPEVFLKGSALLVNAVANLIDDDITTYVNIGGETSFCVQSFMPFGGLTFSLGTAADWSANVNTATVYASVEYYCDDGWKFLEVLEDSSSSANVALAGSGNIRWKMPVYWPRMEYQGHTGYWVRVSFASASGLGLTALSAATYLRGLRLYDVWDALQLNDLNERSQTGAGKVGYAPEAGGAVAVDERTEWGRFCGHPTPARTLDLELLFPGSGQFPFRLRNGICEWQKGPERY